MIEDAAELPFRLGVGESAMFTISARISCDATLTTREALPVLINDRLTDFPMPPVDGREWAMAAVEELCQ